jgi:hypothetical protein
MSLENEDEPDADVVAEPEGVELDVDVAEDVAELEGVDEDVAEALVVELPEGVDEDGRRPRWATSFQRAWR